MDNLTIPLSRDATSAAANAAEEAAKRAGRHAHKWGHWHRSHMGYARRGDLLTAGAFLAVPTFGGYLNSVYAAAKDKEDPWLKSCKMPSWTLPEPMFEPIWKACYASMGLASFLVWRHGGGFSGKAKLPLLLYGGQLALNLSWIPICYKYKSLKMASLTSVGTMVLATAATASFRCVLPAASFIMMPYLVWLLYETCLTISMYNMNKKREE